MIRSKIFLHNSLNKKNIYDIIDKNRYYGHLYLSRAENHNHLVQFKNINAAMSDQYCNIGGQFILDTININGLNFNLMAYKYDQNKYQYYIGILIPMLLKFHVYPIFYDEEEKDFYIIEQLEEYGVSFKFRAKFEYSGTTLENGFALLKDKPIARDSLSIFEANFSKKDWYSILQQEYLFLEDSRYLDPNIIWYYNDR